MLEARQSMQQSFDHFKAQLVGVGTSVNDSLIGTIRIEQDGQQVPLQQLSGIAQRDRRISITPYDPTLVGRIETSLKAQGFDAYKFNPKTVCVNIPLPSGEETERVRGRIRKLGEDAKIAIRNIRRKLKTDDNDNELQTITDSFVEQVDKLVSKY